MPEYQQILLINAINFVPYKCTSGSELDYIYYKRN